MNAHIPPPAPAQFPVKERNWPGRLVTLATVIVVAAVAAATFVLSYTGVHAVALQSGVSVSLARFYPGVFDAVLVIACAAAPLRDARLWARLYTWLVIFLVIGLLGAMDAVHAMSVALPHRQTAGAVAVLPWVLLLLAFTLWLVILRHFRVQHSPRPPQVLLSAPESPASRLAPELPMIAEPAGTERVEEATASPFTPPAGGSLTSSRVAAGSGGEPPAKGDYWESPDPIGPLFDVAPYDATPSGPKPGDVKSGHSGDLGDSDDLGEAAGLDDREEPGHKDESGDIPEVGGVPFVTGPRLRRVRSLPVPPAEDEQPTEGEPPTEDDQSAEDESSAEDDQSAEDGPSAEDESSAEDEELAGDEQPAEGDQPR
jgi:hypothetical protein